MTTSSITSTVSSGSGGAECADDHHQAAGDYVGTREEECGAYKTSTLPIQTQSDQFKQRQEKEELVVEEETCSNSALTSTSLDLFLAKTWNWLHYFFVTIIFLNLVYFTDILLRQVPSCGESVVIIGEAESDQVEDAEEKEHCESESESGNRVEEEDISENSDSIDNGNMSPNTCSIQNSQQEAEVGRADETVATAAPIMTDKVENAIAEEEVVIAPKEESIIAEEAISEKDEENHIEEVAPVEITLIVPEPEQQQLKESDDDDLGRRDSVDSCISSGGSTTEDGSCEKSTEESNDNDSGSDSASTGSADENRKEIAQKIVSQVEAMFSDEHLAKDGFLLKHVRRRSDGFVSLKLVAGLRKVKQISRDFPVVLDALKDSAKLEVNSEGTKVRRVEPLTASLKSLPIKSKDKEQPNGKQEKGKNGKNNGSSDDETQQQPIAAPINNQHNNR